MVEFWAPVMLLVLLDSPCNVELAQALVLAFTL